MVMDPKLRELSAVMSAGMKFDDFVDGGGFKQEEFFPFIDNNAMNLPFDPPDPHPSSSTGLSSDANSPDDGEIFSDIALKYISQMLLEGDLEEQGPVYQESSVLQAAERPFYEILGEQYPPLLDQQLPSWEGLDAHVCGVGGSGTYSSSSSSGSSNAYGGCASDAGETSPSQNVVSYFGDQNSPLSVSLNRDGIAADGLGDLRGGKVEIPDLYGGNAPMWQFQRGLEEASKFLPNSSDLIISPGNQWPLDPELKAESGELEAKVEKKDDGNHPGNDLRGRKNPHPDDSAVEGQRSNKQTAVFQDGSVRTEMFDMVLLCGEARCQSAFTDFQQSLQNGVSKNSQKEHSKGSNGGGRSRGKKQGRKDVVDMSSLLMQCAQSVASDDRRTASEQLKQIRQHSNPFGDGTQRLGHYFANALEARLAGTGSQKYLEFTSKRTTAADILKAYQLYLAACPFKKILHFFANQTILDTVENAAKLHIIDFGIGYGFQWPCFLQRLEGRPGGPPKVRITGIDRPQSGFRPAEQIEETGRRLTDYARTFNIPFEYVSIACSKWETIQVEELKIKRDEVLIVNCMYQFQKLPDETVSIDSPRDLVLKNIRKMNPDVFIHGILNGAYNAPFFITRFRETLFHSSALFDMLETNVPREQPERVLIEREFFGREAMNVIACEGAERVERPETYKQWHVRTMRAGFSPLPMNRDILNKAMGKVRSSYHKDFVIDVDSQWLLQGWKGRINFAISSWRPDLEHL